MSSEISLCHAGHRLVVEVPLLLDIGRKEYTAMEHPQKERFRLLLRDAHVLHDAAERLGPGTAFVMDGNLIATVDADASGGLEISLMQGRQVAAVVWLSASVDDPPPKFDLGCRGHLWVFAYLETTFDGLRFAPQYKKFVAKSIPLIIKAAKTLLALPYAAAALFHSSSSSLASSSSSSSSSASKKRPREESSCVFDVSAAGPGVNEQLDGCLFGVPASPLSLNDMLDAVPLEDGLAFEELCSFYGLVAADAEVDVLEAAEPEVLHPVEALLPVEAAVFEALLPVEAAVLAAADHEAADVEVEAALPAEAAVLAAADHEAALPAEAALLDDVLLDDVLLDDVAALLEAADVEVELPVPAAAVLEAEVPVPEAAVLEAAVLEAAVLEAAVLEAAVLEAAVLEAAVLEAAVLEAADVQVELPDPEVAVLEAVVLEAAVLEAAVLEAAVLEAAVLEAAVLEAAVLEAAVLEAAVLEAAVLEAADVEVELPDPEVAALEAADLEVPAAALHHAEEVYLFGMRMVFPLVSPVQPSRHVSFKRFKIYQ
jgi:uncharacterized protein YjbI with pentapeptide repeats